MLDFGEYYAEIIIDNNDPDQSELIIPVNMTVVDFQATAIADTNAVCAGESIQLYAETIGGIGELHYLWTSDPEAYTSELQNPVFENLTENFIFTLSVTDESSTILCFNT